MNFHIFVLVATISFYILLRIYRKSLPIQKTKSRKSSLIYVLFVPAILYLYNFMYTSGNPQNINVIQQDTISDASKILSDSINISSEPLLTAPFPETSVSIPSTSNT